MHTEYTYLYCYPLQSRQRTSTRTEDGLLVLILWRVVEYRWNGKEIAAALAGLDNKAAARTLLSGHLEPFSGWLAGWRMGEAAQCRAARGATWNPQGVHLPG